MKILKRMYISYLNLQMLYKPQKFQQRLVIEIACNGFKNE